MGVGSESARGRVHEGKSGDQGERGGGKSDRRNSNTAGGGGQQEGGWEGKSESLRVGNGRRQAK